MDLTPGTLLLGKYRIEELIGSGGMGNVVRASHLFLHQPVAIKVLLPQMAESDSTKQRFIREAQATIKLRSEHSVRVMDVGSSPEGVPFMVMEFLEGNDLNQILRHHGPQAPSIVVDLMLQACEGIAEAHALGIIHRDIKPSNFFITRRPDGSMLLKILDFGISKTPVGYDELTGTQTVIGTPSYMAPEQMKSGRAADPRSDLWSIGVVMYQLMNGQPPFSGESYAELVLKVGLEPPSPMMVQLPPGLGDVVLRCLEKDPNARHQNVGELARMLAPYATDPVAAAQSASRAMRTLQHRGGQSGPASMPGALYTTQSGGLATPVPLSPAQLTPRSWAPSTHGTSLSHGAGQMTQRPRGARGWMIASVAAMCVLAAGIGYGVSQLSRGKAERDEPHVQVPTTQPVAAPPPPTVKPAEPPPAAVAPTPAPTIPEAPPAEHKPEVVETKPAEAKPAEPPPAEHKPEIVEPKPAIVEHKPETKPAIVEHKPETKPAVVEHKPETKPAIVEHKPEPKPAIVEHKPETKPAVVETKPETKPAVVEHKPAAKPAVVEHKPAVAKPATKPVVETKPAAKPATKPATKTKKDEDLFDSRH